MNKKLFSWASIFGLCMTILASSIGAGMNTLKASAESFDGEPTTNTGGQYETKGLFISLSLSINGGDGKVWATAKNDFTLFPATVIVIVELYSSYEYYESYEKMTLITANTSMDLNFNKTLVAEASTNGEQRYWQARMRYKADNRDWKSEHTATCKIGASGEFLGYI